MSPILLTFEHHIAADLVKIIGRSAGAMVDPLSQLRRLVRAAAISTRSRQFLSPHAAFGEVSSPVSRINCRPANPSCQYPPARIGYAACADDLLQIASAPDKDRAIRPLRRSPLSRARHVGLVFARCLADGPQKSQCHRLFLVNIVRVFHSNTGYLYFGLPDTGRANDAGFLRGVIVPETWLFDRFALRKQQ